MHLLLIALFISLAEARRPRYKAEVSNPDFVLPNILPGTYYDIPVRADRVYRRGYGDIDFNEPIDVLAHHMDVIRNPYAEAEKTLVRDGNRIKWQRKKDYPLGFQSPRDEMLYYRPNAIGNASANSPKVYDFSKHLEENLAKEDVMFETKNVDKVNVSYKPPSINVSGLFEDNAFFLKTQRKEVQWTSCEEFARGALFHPDDIVNTQWLPFYVWSIRHFSWAKLHTFVYPTKKVVQYYKTVYGPYVRKLNWKQPKLLLKEAREMLLIAADRRGLFYGVPRHELSDSVRKNNITLPLIKLRLKIFNPYLALMYCDDNYATLMAELGTEPATNAEKIQEASTLKFTGMGRPVRRNIAEETFMSELLQKRREQAEPKKYLNILTGALTNK